MCKSNLTLIQCILNVLVLNLPSSWIAYVLERGSNSIGKPSAALALCSSSFKWLQYRRLLDQVLPSLLWNNSLWKPKPDGPQ